MIRVSIDARQLIRYQDKISRAPAAVRRAAAKSINAAGRRMVDEMAIALARETGLPLDTTTNLYTVEEATPENLRFRVRASRSLVQPTSNRPIQPHQPQRPDEFFRPGELVRVVTAGDDRVCEKCEELAANSPYTIEEARAAIPHHPHCRCKVMPYGQRRMQMQVQRDNQTMQERISLRRLAQESIEATRIELRVT